MSKKRTWAEPLDHEGNATYNIDFTPEMTALGDTLSTVEVTLSDKAIAAGLNKAFEQVNGNIYSCKFSIPQVGDQNFTSKGQPLEMEVKYTTAAGEIDAFTAAVHIKDK